jgi:hypothetical protein
MTVETRANGEGPVHKRKSDGHWVAQLTLGGGPDCGRQTWTTYHKLKHDAVVALAALSRSAIAVTRSL